ncbi:MAG TPA: hypothetical protein VFN96_01150, partial [Gemmatimonadales bacterium]|nr:hypothetical protein [Gemmatimonadales bacterium]
PEQGAGDPAMDHRVDIYAFGAMAYEILSGDPPFTGNSPHAILGGHIAGIAKPITSLRPGLPPLLGHIVMQCLEKRPADRPQSADELIRSLDALATPSGGTVPLSPISGHVALRDTARSRARWSALAAAAVVLLAIGATFAWLRGPEPAETPVAQAPAVPLSRRPAVQLPAPPAPKPALDTFRPETTTPAPVRREPSREELALLDRLQGEAAGARARAVAAGVPDSVLARGDSNVARAGRLAARQRTAAAAAQLSTASTLWSSAAAEPRIATTPAPAPDTVATAAPEPVRAPAAPPPRPPAPKPPPADPAPQIRALFQEYGSAIESRSVDAVRRVYPGLTPAQTREWEEFFQGVSGIEVELQVTALEVTGDSAEAQLAGLYVFDNPSTHRTQRESVAFQARLRREGGRWRIASLR